ncbi:MAG: carboxylesterase/lipase family protein [Acidimicrobiales bacterium]
MDAPVVETAGGRVAGVRDGRGVMSFHGIPFAQPPVGPLRFLPARPAAPWTGVRDGSLPASLAPQTLTPIERLAGATESQLSENCLYLNVWTADCQGQAPVLLWVHGGAFLNGGGSIPWYDGASLASRHGVVVVTFNYRLGALGFTHLAERGGERYAGSGNAGLSDQVAALRWVAGNVGAFGGDPGRICVVGESAGAMSVGALLGVPEARDLLSAAVLQSGACANTMDRESASRTTARLFESAGIPPDDVAAFARLPLDTLLAAQAALAADHPSGMPLGPVVDGVMLVADPLDAVRSGDARSIPLVIGTNREETLLFGLLDPSLASLTEESLTARVTELFGADTPDALAAYRTSVELPTPARLWGAIMDDRIFRVPAARLAEACFDAGGSCWSYLFEWRSPAFGGILGACHGLEVPFVFDNLDQPGVEAFTGAGADRQRIATAMASAWTSFAGGGEPAGCGLPRWPRYAPPGRSTMLLGEECRVEDDPLGELRRLWDDRA